MGSESCGSNQLPIFKRMQTGICYSCKKPGHWSKDCPDKQPQKRSGEFSPSSSSPSSYGGGGYRPMSSVEGSSFPEKQCPCGSGACSILTSNTEKNPGRKFYRCPNPRASGMDCGFFQWCDLESFNTRSDVPRTDVPVSPRPMCSCGAGVCSLLTTKEGQNKGRRFYVCPVTRGQGACNFFQWEDSPMGNTTKGSKGYLDERQYSPRLTSDGKETRRTDDSGKYVSEVENIYSSPGSVGKGFESPLAKEYSAKEEKDCFQSKVHDDLLSPIRNLKLNDADSTSTFAKPQHCYRGGKSTHWMKDCTISSSPCFKCGKTGHWMKDCTA